MTDVGDGSQLVGEASPSRGAHGRHERPPRRPSRRRRTVATRATTAQDEHLAAGLDRELAEVGGDQDAGAAGPGVGDHVEGGLDADRVDAVEGLVEQQHLGLVHGGQHHREPPAHAVREPAGDPVGGVAELEPFEQVAGARLPVAQPAQPRGRAGGAPRESRAGPGRRRRGSSRPHAWPRAAAYAGRSPRPAPTPAVGGTTPASTRMVVDLPAPLRPSSPVAWPAYAARSMPETASTSPNRTCRSARRRRARTRSPGHDPRKSSPSRPPCPANI